jgi:hypothetical protein
MIKQKAGLSPEQVKRLEQIAASMRALESRPDRIVLSGQVDETLASFVRDALGHMTKTELVNAALAALFEVEVVRAAQ